jgi:carbon monoxide dehydrogenase subunit G
MDVHRSIDIAAPSERVWPFLVDPDKVMRWFVGLREFRYLDDGSRKTGARVHWRRSPSARC